MIRDIDSLPPSLWDQRLAFEGFFSFPSHCRFRLYHSHDQVPLIVLTEVEDNPGTSITNRAERVHYLAWAWVGKSWPCRFFEHYPGWRGAHSRSLEAERLDEVLFAGTSGDGPNVVLTWLGGPSGHRAAAFQHPRWQELTLATFGALLGRGPDP